MDPDSELLRQFAEQGSQRAFGALVERTVGFVYAAALRQTGGDVHLARDVTQGVYLAVACRANALKRHAVLAGWLHTTTRYLANKAVRAQVRWQRREREANVMLNSQEGEQAWERLRPIIDEVLGELNEKDRTVLLLRFFNDRSLAEIGRTVGVSENAARMRVDRALEKLRLRLVPRGITSTAAALGTAFASQPAFTVPAGLVTVASSLSAAAATASAGGVLAAVTFMKAVKVSLVGAVLVIAAGVTGYQVSQSRMQPQVEAAMARAVSQREALAVLERNNAAFRKELGERARGAQVTPSARHVTIEENLRVLAQLGSKGIVRTGLSIVEVEGTIEPRWADALGLTAADTGQLAVAIAKARAELGRHDLANSRAELQPDGRLVITVQPYSDGAAIYDELLSTFRGVLGSERFSIFATFGMEHLEDHLHQLGIGKKVLTLKHDRARAGERNEYQMTLRIERPNGTVKQGLATDRRIDGLIAHMIGPLTRHIPPSF